MSVAYQPEYMEEAIALARMNATTAEGGPFGAVIVHNGSVVAKAANRVTAKADPTAHAEIEAIRLACQAVGSHRLESAVLYSSCEPCPMCLGAIYWAGIGHVFYAADSADANAFGFADAIIYQELAIAATERKVVTMEQRDRAGAVAAFERWLENPLKEPY